MEVKVAPRVVLVEDVLEEAPQRARALEAAGYPDVLVHSTALAALAELDTGAPRIVVLDQLLLGPGSLALTRRLRARADGGSLFVLVMSGEAELAGLVPALGSGVDDVIMKPVRTAELVARLRGAERKLAFETQLRRRVDELEKAVAPIVLPKPEKLRIGLPALPRTGAPGIVSLTPASPVASLVWTDAWDELDARLASTFREFFTRPVTILAHEPSDPVGGAVEIRMAEPASEVEVTITMFVDGASCESLAKVLLGDADAEAQEALLLETANIAMGSLKAAFAHHDLSFTGGIPYPTTVSDATRASASCTHQRRMSFEAGDATLDVWVRAESKKNVAHRITELREGMVIAADVRDADGNTLLRTGTRLTATTAEWLTKLAADLSVVVSDVGVAA
jgi:CheY-like chemotaxis protein